MTTEEIIIAIVRVLGSLPVLVFPFWGGLLAVFTDLSDLFLMNLLDEGGVGDYQQFDKWLDQVYMLTFLIVALRWEGPARTVAVVLYAYRMVGFVAFEATGERDVLLFFPNAFEFWFLFVAGMKQFGLEGGSGKEEGAERAMQGGVATTGRQKTFRYGAGEVAAVLAALLALKVGQEYALHVGRWFDSFTAVEAVEWVWGFVTPPY